MDYPRLMDIKKLMSYTSLGRNSCRKIGQEAGAVVRYGSKVLYDRVKIDEFIERMEHE